MRLVGEAAGGRGRDQCLALSQEATGKLDAAIDAPGMRSQSGRFAEYTDQVPGAQTRMFGKCREVDVLADMGKKKILGFRDRLGLFAVGDRGETAAMAGDCGKKETDQHFVRLERI